MTTADLDGDGDADLVAANTGAYSVSVLINQGGGTFMPHVTYTVGYAPSFVASVDLDGDGDADLAVAAANWIAVLLNHGDGTFATYTHYGAGASPTSLATADLDGDGDIDLATANKTPSSNTISVLLNHGDGTFATYVQYTVDLSPYFVTSADLDGDGDVDLAAADFYARVSVLSNHGDGTFAPHVSYDVAAYPNSVISADLEGDGDVDLITLAPLAHTVSVLTNQGDGTFATYVQYGVGFAGAMTSADLDGDGDADLATANPDPGTVSVLRNCATSGMPFCLGDGSGTSCPCGNDSDPESASGCLNSLALGGTLRGSGRATLSSDQLVLTGAQMPNSLTLYFQGTSSINGGAGTVFGDGLRCLGGASIRLGTKANLNNQSHYPDAGDTSLSVKGVVTSPGERFYQALYRDPASFCTNAMFNLTNGLRVTWAPYARTKERCTLLRDVPANRFASDRRALDHHSGPLLPGR